MESNRKKILVFSDWFLPGYKAGGPIRSVANLVGALGEIFDFYVLTRNTDFDETEPYPGVETNEWMPKGAYKVNYLDPEHQSMSYYRKIISDLSPDLVYLNSFFSFRFTISALMALRFSPGNPRVIIAPRGMLGEGALKIKGIKKRLFIRLARLFGLYKNVIWHASTEFESLEIHAVFGKKARVMVARNFVDLEIASKSEIQTNPVGERRLVFISRISPKKNLKKAIEFFVEAAPGKSRLDIYGPIEDQEYWGECQELINKSGLSIQYKGELSHGEVGDEFKKADALLFPSHNENFGHIIVESFASGCPVILSDQTPWRDLNNKGLGWDLPLDEPRSFCEAIGKILNLAEGDLLELKQNCLEFSTSVKNDPAVFEANKKLFKACLKD